MSGIGKSIHQLLCQDSSVLILSLSRIEVAFQKISARRERRSGNFDNPLAEILIGGDKAFILCHRLCKAMAPFRICTEDFPPWRGHEYGVCVAVDIEHGLQVCRRRQGRAPEPGDEIHDGSIKQRRLGPGADDVELMGCAGRLPGRWRRQATECSCFVLRVVRALRWASLRLKIEVSVCLALRFIAEPGGWRRAGFTVHRTSGLTWEDDNVGFPRRTLQLVSPSRAARDDDK